MHHIFLHPEHFGYLGIIVTLILGIIGIPLPDETLLTFVGYNVSVGNLSYSLSLASAITGSIGGISLSYFLGYKFGLPLLKKIGPKLHITNRKIAKTRLLFRTYGPFLLLIGYFIPGVRHLTAYIAAMNKFSYKRFALYAYSGAALWCFTFITFGKALGERWINIRIFICKYNVYTFLLILFFLLIVYFLWKKRKKQN